MLTKSQESLIKNLHTKKGRRDHGLLLVEGDICIAEAGSNVEWTFGSADSERFADLVTTETPQHIAGVARIPEWTLEDVIARPVVVVLDGVQDPGNVGTILRLARAFNASVVAIDSADITNPKVVRSSAGSLFHVPWLAVSRGKAVETISGLGRSVYRIEKRAESAALQQHIPQTPCAIILGSEGNGIVINIEAPSLMIEHDDALESLNVTHATAIVLYSLYVG